MDTDNLIHMANRIGEFFQAMPDRDEATTGVATHLRRYWEPRMRRGLLEHVNAHEGVGLSPIVLDAVLANREMLA